MFNCFTSHCMEPELRLRGHGSGPKLEQSLSEYRTFHFSDATLVILPSFLEGTFNLWYNFRDICVNRHLQRELLAGSPTQHYNSQLPPLIPHRNSLSPAFWHEEERAKTVFANLSQFHNIWLIPRSSHIDLWCHISEFRKTEDWLGLCCGIWTINNIHSNKNN